MRALAIMLAILMIASVATAEKKQYVEPMPNGSRALDCTNAIPIDCGDTVVGDTYTNPNVVQEYSCVGWSETGGETVYELRLDGPECQVVTAALTVLAGDPDVYILGSCDETDCIAHGDASATTGCLEPGVYYIVVDGYYGNPAADYELTVTCTECDCPVPACCPFENTVYMVDFNDEAAEEWFWTQLCDGVHAWEWSNDIGAGVPDVACDDVPITLILGTRDQGDYPNEGGEIAAVGPFSIDQYSTCLELCHFVWTEPAYDGGNVKVSTDGGSTWTLITPADGYPGSTNGSPFCIPDEPAFTGNIMTAFERDCFDLTPFIDMEIIVGFHFGSDASGTDPGWYIKWLKIGSNDTTPVEDSSWGNLKAMYR